jgi:long-subunit fatty acid transport protein
MRFLGHRVGLVVALFLLFASNGSTQGLQDIFETRFEAYNFEFNGNGARAMGMGNAFLGIANDVSSISWNPAGIYQMESPVLGVSYTTLNPRGEFQSDRLNFSTSTFGTRNTFSHGGSLGALAQASFLAPIRIKGHPFVGSIAYTRNSNEFQKQGYNVDIIELFPVFNEVGVFLGTDTVQEAAQIVSQLEGGIDAINVGFGTRIRENLAFGAAVNVYSGKVQRHSDILITADSLPVNNRQFGDLAVVAQETDSNTFSGFNVTVGFKFDGEMVDAGLVVRTPFSLNQKREKFYYEVVNVNDVPLATDTTYTIDLLTKYDIPLMIGFGIGYQMRENWLFGFDVEYRNFSNSQIKIRENLILVPGGSNIEEFSVLTDQEWQWSNIFLVRAGTEYLHKTGIGTVPLRAGLGYVPLPAPNVDPSGNRSTSTSYQFALGSGIHWNQIKLDVAYMYKTYDLEFGYFIAEEKSKNHFINVSFTGYF